MEVSKIINAIDEQISKLQEARSLLSGTANVVGKAGRGRPKGSKNAPKTVTFAPKRVMSEEGRARIAAAQRKRHALRKRNANKAAAVQEKAA